MMSWPARTCGASARPVDSMNVRSGSMCSVRGVGTQISRASASAVRAKSVVASKSPPSRSWRTSEVGMCPM